MSATPRVYIRPMTTAERARAARLGFICGWREGLPARCALLPDTAVTDRFDGRFPVDGEVGDSGTWHELCDEHAYTWGLNRLGSTAEAEHAIAPVSEARHEAGDRLGLPDEARCGVCSEPIVASRSVNQRVTWCHAEVPVGNGHVAIYLPDAGGVS